MNLKLRNPTKISTKNPTENLYVFSYFVTTQFIEEESPDRYNEVTREPIIGPSKYY
jgi:hypothetical protein